MGAQKETDLLAGLWADKTFSADSQGKAAQPAFVGQMAVHEMWTLAQPGARCANHSTLKDLGLPIAKRMRAHEEDRCMLGTQVCCSMAGGQRAGCPLAVPNHPCGSRHICT